MKTNTIQSCEQKSGPTSRAFRLTSYPASLLAGVALLSLALLTPNKSSAGPQGPESHVDSVSVTIKALPSLGARHRSDQFYARAKVVIVDDFGVPVAGAKVKVEFTGNLLRRPVSASGTTDEFGEAVIDSKPVGYSSGPLSFMGCVTKVESSLAWDGVELCDTASR